MQLSMYLIEVEVLHKKTKLFLNFDMATGIFVGYAEDTTGYLVNIADKN